VLIETVAMRPPGIKIPGYTNEVPLRGTEQQRLARHGRGSELDAMRELAGACWIRGLSARVKAGEAEEAEGRVERFHYSLRGSHSSVMLRDA
jgi:hypothetical protein